MLDSPTVRAVADILEPLLQAKFPGAVIMQKYMPTAQGVPTGPVVFMHKVSDHRDGFARTDYGFRTTGEKVPSATVQLITSRWQFSALYPNNGVDEDEPLTASDMLRYVALLMSVNAILQTVRQAGLNPMRITDVTNPQSTNDREQFTTQPTFDVILQHHERFEIEANRLEAVQIEIHAV